MEVLKNSVQNSLKQIIKDNGLEEYNISLASGSKPGDNYNGILYKIQVSNKNSKLNLCLKVPRNYEINIKPFFEREELMYKTIIPKFLNIQNEKNITLADKFKSVAKCYGANSVVLGEEYVVLADLSADGFKLRHMFDVIDFDHCKLVMEALGKLHALSFALNDQNPEFVAQHKDAFPEPVFKKPLTKEFIGFFEPFIQYAKSNIQVESKYQQQWLNFIENFISHAQYCCSGELAGKYRIISHGDVWNNNTMYRYENGSPVDVCFLDFQVSRYVSPVLDLMTFLCSSTEKPFRDLHFENLINMYHNTLSTFLTKLGCDPEKLFPYSVFQDHLKQFGKFGLCISVFGLQISYMREGDGITVNETRSDQYNKLIIDLINDMAKLGYI